MPPRKVVRGRPARRNVEKQELPNSPEVQPQGEVTNAEFREAIKMLSQVVTNQVGQKRGAQQGEADTSRIHEFLRMNPPSFTGSSTTEDPENFIEELKSVFEVMHVVDTERVELATYQLKNVSRTWVLEFEVDDWVYLKVSPMKGVLRFGKKGKLSPRYIGPYRISKRIGNVAYELELPKELAAVHPVFHTSMLKKCMGDPSLIIPTENIGIKDSLSYKEIPVQILDYQVRKLRTKEVASVKVLWMNQFIGEATWEAEEDMKKRYPHIFEY
ncbi:hypothetical protein MTR67_026531 [Solanum verrucosum]|uniref:Tf2-1-like SH3-like domain-containing protein n=1 Tax=Solanum verrucosum TaxID=315347 RepID=A0AAF0R7D8_SOLVR|nr:hypothetical protein MTR67_026531 [Solanum verrucosum]